MNNSEKELTFNVVLGSDRRFGGNLCSISKWMI